jgi:hypothetical protein
MAPHHCFTAPLVLATVGAAALVANPAHALNPANCEDDVVVRPQWVSFEAMSGVRFGDPLDAPRLVLAGDAAYTLGLTTLAPRIVDGLCQYDLDSAVDFVRAGVGYQRSLTDFEALETEPQWVLGDVSWFRIFDSLWRGSAGVAFDHGFLAGDASATSLGGLFRVNFADWVSLSARLGTVVAAEGVPTGGFSTTLALGIEPRLWCEHVTREKCEPSWFITSLLK